jgi:hypothetical protein
MFRELPNGIAHGLGLIFVRIDFRAVGDIAHEKTAHDKAFFDSLKRL